MNEQAMYFSRLFLLMLLLVPMGKPVNAEILVAEALIKVKGAGWEGTRITILPEFGEAYEIPMTSNRFELELGLQASYLIRAEHPECPTKEVFFDCRIPTLLESWDFEFPFEITLEKFPSAERSFTYAQPVGLVFFDEAKEDFAYSTDYSRIMKATSIQQMQVRMSKRSLLDNGSGAGAVSQRLLSNSGASPELASDTREPLPTTVLHSRKIATVEPIVELNHEPSPIASSSMEPNDPLSSTSAVLEEAMESKTRTALMPERVLSIAKQPIAVASTRSIHSTSSRTGECGTHEFLSQRNRVIVIDRVPAPDGCVELRKVVHSYGEIFYFHDGRSVTEPVYNEVLTARRSD